MYHLCLSREVRSGRHPYHQWTTQRYQGCAFGQDTTWEDTSNTCSLDCHYPPDKCNAPRPQFFSKGCVSSTDSGTGMDCQLFGLGSKAGPHIGPNIGGSFGTQKAGYFFRAPARAPATFFRATIFRREISQKPKNQKLVLLRTLLSNMYSAPPLPKGKLPRLPRPRVANYMSPIVGQTHGAPGSPHPPVSPLSRSALHCKCVAGQPRLRSWSRSRSLLVSLTRVVVRVMVSSRFLLYSQCQLRVRGKDIINHQQVGWWSRSTSFLALAPFRLLGGL